MNQLYNYDSIQRFHGLSTDTKPTGCTNGSRFIEIDTGNKYIYNATSAQWVLIPKYVPDYNEATNKPSINGVTLVGDKSFADLGIPNPMLFKGRLDTVEDLEDVEDPEVGWWYLIGLVSDPVKAEYIYTDDEYWELVGYNTLVIDSALSSTSENPVQNKAIYAGLATKADLSILTPISESAYEALTTYTNPLYFIYEDAQ